MSVITWPDVPKPEDMYWAKAFPLPESGNMLRRGEQARQVWIRQGTRMASQLVDVIQIYCEKVNAPDLSVLDFGCGNGRIALPLHFKHGIPTACVDVDPVCVEYIGRVLRGVVAQLVSSVPPTSIPDWTFDVVYAVSVWTHFSLDAQEAWLDEVRRILKPGGLAVITTSGYAALASRRKRLADWQDVDDETLRREGCVFRKTRSPRGVSGSYGYAAHDPVWVRERWGRRFEYLEVRKGAIEGLQDCHVMRSLG